MKNPHPLSNTWTGSISEEPVLITASSNKKFKRKSREPKRLKTYPADMSDIDSIDDIQTETCNVSRLAPLQRQLMMSQDMMASTTGILSGLTEGHLAPAHGSAIDMRTGVDLPAIPSKLTQLHASTFCNPEISHWPTAISQPLPNRLKLGLCSTFPLSTSTSSNHSDSPNQQAFSLEPSQLGKAVPLPVHRASQTSQCHELVEPQVQSPKVNVWSVSCSEVYQ